MNSKIIAVHNSGQGFIDAQQETREFAAQAGLSPKQGTQLCLITEEMLSLVHSVTGTLNAEFWLENEGTECKLHLTARQKLGNTQRNDLIESSSSGKNEAAKGFLGKLREAFEQAMSIGADVDRFYGADGYQAGADISDKIIAMPKWDKYERSVLLALSDDVKVSIRGGVVDLTVLKKL